MPLQVDALTPDSPMEMIREAMSASMEQCMKEGKPQKQCAAMMYDIARKKTGKPLNAEQ